MVVDDRMTEGDVNVVDVDVNVVEVNEGDVVERLFPNLFV